MSISVGHLLSQTFLILIITQMVWASKEITSNVKFSPADASDDKDNDLPVVNLGYARYRATAFNQTGQYYNFSNIRYAAPPLGNLRWQDPAPPLKEDEVNNGSIGFTCPQSIPNGFFNSALLPIVPYIAPGISGQSQSEDCLFLDVVVPLTLFEQGQSQKRSSKLAPVLVNIHGGGFFEGDKTAIYWPGGLLERGDNGFVYVSMNYRVSRLTTCCTFHPRFAHKSQLSAFGFLSGLEPSDKNLTSPNAGLMDQRAALKWVRSYIHLFGGDAHQVTVTGQSAGGSSIQYHSIAYGGSRPEENNLFVRGNVQSPGTLTQCPKYAELSANLFLQAAGVTSVDAARNLSTDILMKANVAAQAQTPFSAAFFTPVIDGVLVPDIPPRAYNNGKFIKENLSFLISNEQNEARLLGNQSVTTNKDFDNWVSVTFPYATLQQRDHITETLYPPIYDGSHTYTSPYERNQLATKEYLISCNTFSIARAYDYQTHNYIFGLPPAIHSQDLTYTYYPTGATPDFYPNVAIAVQSYITGFVLTGSPNGNAGLPNFPVVNQIGRALNFTTTGINHVTSDAFNARCEFWTSGDYFPNGD